ncbi:MAG: hypothetical protein F6J98_15970 [Moorea sp. SIO4G2]|uniref:hypothetical protein n=1 Tax=unclassified Moorena TaxID=2683338 RepID=UPI0013FAD806|nr:MULTISPECIES: hypothetical protein [unclassified Moorena]NEO11962.1 hypothetical protein [Moorena sp. SIO3E8]NEO61844.1 hypothetical protein [Moorena sp. SIO4G2]NEP99011.1 hypothetical protein [Moorena sp. SIO3F7]
MNKINQDNQYLLHPSIDDLAQLPSSFIEAVTRVKTFALLEMEKETERKQLYYHNCDHVKGVQRRADRIFQAIRPYWEACLDNDIAADYLSRMKQLIDLCAIAHDMVQEFLPQIKPHTSRRRENGVSEAATITKLLDYIKNQNEWISKQTSNHLTLFTDSDLQIITEAINATICWYDSLDNTIYQPDLYSSDKNLSLVARIIALADLGTLGMEGIEAFNQEGSLLFLEENPDIIPILLNHDLPYYEAIDKQTLYENLRQRLLKRTRFQVNFAKGRMARFARELKGLTAEAISVLTQDVFKYLNPAIIQEIELLTPTANDTNFEELIEFFKLENYVEK